MTMPASYKALRILRPFGEILPVFSAEWPAVFSVAFPVLPEESAASPEVLQAFPGVLSAVRGAVHEEAREEDYEAALPAVFPEGVPDWLLRKRIRSRVPDYQRSD